MDNLRRMAERHLGRLRRRTKDDTLILDLRDLTNAIIEEGNRLSAIVPQTPPPSRAVTSLDRNEIARIFHLTRGTPMAYEFEASPREPMFLPPHLEAVLSDYDLAMGRTTTTEASSRSRIDAIILLTLAQMKKDVAADPRSSVSSVRSTHSLHIQHETYVSMPWEFPDGLYVLRGKVDCSVWYENPDCLETNCVLVEAKRLGDVSMAVPQCLTYMAMVYWTRKRAGLSDLSVWGIATDSNYWNFIHIRPDGTFATEIYIYHNTPLKIMCMISKLYRRVAQTAELPTKNKRWTAASGISFASYETALEEIQLKDADELTE
ncbi:hypothetical protein N7452_005030 [Penicillium brevicompactum]|uniref:Uncharacterized protein n=1 Tax=Penicillium brevicompactum TaxID=5074 RepID=A0A9W9UER5_PENBR|nr:hypothetical protein N7452_005030 [Penicillium brevicompactum]